MQAKRIALHCKENDIQYIPKGDDQMAQVNFRVDDAIKEKAESACTAMGLTMSSAINIFLTKVANERRIPFEVCADPFYSDDHLAKLERRVADMKEGKNMHEHELIGTE